MLRRIASGIIVTLLLTSMLTLTLNIQPVKGTGTIYIRADGSVDPDTAPISTADNTTYTFTDNIYDSIVVKRDNIVIDGAGHTIRGTGSGRGIYLSYRSNVTIRNIEIKGFDTGIWLHYSSNNTIPGNNITNNSFGIVLGYSTNNRISENNITVNDWEGIQLYASSNNVIFGNNMRNNWYGVFL